MSWWFCMDSGEVCWWTVHPASKQRSEGEKVRAGDDLILVSVSSERYLVSKSIRSFTWLSIYMFVYQYFYAVWHVSHSSMCRGVTVKVMTMALAGWMLLSSRHCGVCLLFLLRLQRRRVDDQSHFINHINICLVSVCRSYWEIFMLCD